MTYEDLMHALTLAGISLVFNDHVAAWNCTETCVICTSCPLWRVADCSNVADAVITYHRAGLIDISEYLI